MAEQLSPGPDTQVYSDECAKVSKLKGLKIIHLNARSLVNKISQIRLLCKDTNADFLCISESWLSPDHDDIEFSINGYKLFRKDRIGRNGGGVCVYSKINNNYLIDSIEMNTDLEILVLNISHRLAKPFYLVTIYRPPNSSAEYMTKIMETLRP